jgi:hypothetical protein
MKMNGSTGKINSEDTGYVLMEITEPFLVMSG